MEYRRGRSGRLSPLGTSFHPQALIFLMGTLFGFYVCTLFESDSLYSSTGKLSFLTVGRDKTLDKDSESGWNRINVFYGSSDHVESLISPKTQWYSQARQDEAVVSLLRAKRNGFFVDLASNDATINSNSYALEKNYGWRGLCIEPNPHYFYNLTRYRKNCDLVAAVIGSNRMEKVHFFEAGDHSGIVGFDNPERLRKKSRQEYTVTLLEVFERFNVPREIDYLSLDVEGAEEYVMNALPLERYHVKLMTVERPNLALRELLVSNGYMQIQRLSRWGETLWAHRDIIDELDMSRLDEFNARRQHQLAKSSKENTEATKNR